MAGRRNPLGQAITAAALLAFHHATRLLPFRWCRPVGIAIGRLAHALLPRVSRVSRQNLDLAYGDTLPPAEKRRIARAAAEHMGIVAAEFSHLPWLLRNLHAGWLRVEGMEHFIPSGGLLMVSAHIGNWEALALAYRRIGARPAEVVRPLDNPVVNALVDQTRRAGGVATIPKLDAATEILVRLRQGEVVGILADQAPRENAAPVTFFGQPCWATIGPVMIGMRGRVPVQPVALLRNATGGYTLRLWPPVQMVHTGDLHTDLEANSQRIQDALEEMVRAHPEQWLWAHRRWKRRERLEAEWEARKARAQRRRQTAT